MTKIPNSPLFLSFFFFNPCLSNVAFEFLLRGEIYFPTPGNRLALWLDVANRKDKSGSVPTSEPGPPKVSHISAFALFELCPIPWEQSQASLPDNDSSSSTKSNQPPDILLQEAPSHSAEWLTQPEQTQLRSKLPSWPKDSWAITNCVLTFGAAY